MYIVTLGECEYTRTYPPPSTSHTSALYYNGQNIQNETNSLEINLGLILTPGHFSFMDGFPDNELTYLINTEYNEKKRCISSR